ncbi:A disintegrin and metalloproteinase with thrombospondin motifs 7 [Amia ocellicauda]|uniref:A disintegrin and metalloproteinase with thrombospondin motifs 7 n=1 Tax=Amia ocellicauda TaxID=2972642 RepID=UPI003463B666
MRSAVTMFHLPDCRSFTHFFVAVWAVLETGQTSALGHAPESILQDLGLYEVVLPTRLDAGGRFLSYSLSHRVQRVHRRDISTGDRSSRVFYSLQHGGLDLRLNLSLSTQLLAPGFVTERRYGGLVGAKIHSYGSSLCHFSGEVWDETSVRGSAAISTCDGLTGLFKLAEEDFFIQPLERTREEGVAQAHVIYKRHALVTPPPPPQEHSLNGTCGVKGRGGAAAERGRERWEQKQRRRRIRQRSISQEKWVETLVVADRKMVQYHGSQQVETYVLTVMNIVAGLFRDASIGNSINIVVVRLILLEEEEEDLKITHHADNTLNSFCKWQKSINVKGDENPVHHDVAVLITRKDICAAMNRPCETLGLSHVAGMCQPHRSCSLSEDTGLPVAFTVAHELGHNFGIQHDGNGNDCEPIGKRPFIMSPQLLYGTSPPSWSRCSQQYITRFLDRGWGLCLDDPPVRDELEMATVPPGVLYSAAHQCRLQYGSGSLFCDDMDDVCSTLWCTVGNTCHSKLDGAADGTKCGLNKWCFGGECVRVGYRPESVNGGWASWSTWASCTRTCGAGVQSAERECSNPVPKHGGRYCLGERRRYRVCNTEPCLTDQPSFRHAQCSHFNTMPYKGKLYTWVPVNNRVHPCELHCRPLDEYFSEKLLDAAIDGTRCFEGTSSRDICVNGICKNVGCDYEIDSNAVEDRCGVCHGNGSTCETVKKTFEESEGLGYVDIGLIPEGARDILIQEVEEAGNFLALRSSDRDRYFLNGDWTIQWNGDYKAAGTTFTYERTGNLENLTSPGPTLEPVWIQLLFQEKNPGVRYEYTIQREPHSDIDLPPPGFLWQYGAWTECSATCGTGVQRQIVHCVEETAGIVEEIYCDPATRPDDKQASCNEELCPARWWVGEWQKCSVSCGASGLMKRTVLCVQSVGLDEQRALPSTECEHMAKPEVLSSCNTLQPCPADWIVGNWSECSVTCGGGEQSRNVTCSRNTGADCGSRKKPSSQTPCNTQNCPKVLDVFGTDWSGSGSSSKELFNEINSIPDGSRRTKPGQGVTKARPAMDYGSLNNIIEGGVPVHNGIEQTNDNSLGTNVFVDDFYYDYNFINFHEDLSYGLDIEKEEDNEIAAEEKVGTNSFVEEHDHNSGITKNSDKESTKAEQPADSTGGHGENQNGNVLYEEEVDEINPDVSENEGEEDEIFLSVNHLLPVVNPTIPSVDRAVSSVFENGQDANGGFPSERPTVIHNHDTDHTTNPAEEVFSISSHETGKGEEPELENTHDLGLGRPTDEVYNRGWENDGTNHDSDNRADPMAASEAEASEVTEGTQVLIGGERDDAGDLDFRPHKHSKNRFPVETREDNASSVEENEEDELSSKETPVSHPSLPRHNLLGTETNKKDVSSQQNPLTTAMPQKTTPSQYYFHKLMTTVRPSLNNVFEGQSSDQYYKTEIDLKNEIITPPIINPEPVVTSSFFQAPPPTTSYSEHPAFSHPSSPSTEVGKVSSSRRLGEDRIFSTSAKVPTTSLASQPAGSVLAAENTAVTAQFDQGEARAPTPGAGWSEIDSNEIIIPDMLRHQNTKHFVTNLPEDGNSSLPAHLQKPTTPAGPRELLQMPTPPSGISGVWAVGNWSVCSTSCGLGAIWRAVSCSTGQDTDCDITKRPPPARRCYLRPCSAWRVGEWGKCSRNCGGGVKLREIQCFDTRDRRPLRPFHCRAVSHKPPVLTNCNSQVCLDWYTMSWGECSQQCGGGDQVRLVTCPETDKCDEAIQPHAIQSCNTHPCTKWVLGSWGQCSASCGGGLQRRLVKCVNTKTEREEEDRAQCEHESWPESTHKCNTQDCDSIRPSQPCPRDHLTFRFCQTLQLLGRCSLATVRAQCCQTCSARSRGNERITRR